MRLRKAATVCVTASLIFAGVGVANAETWAGTFGTKNCAPGYTGHAQARVKGTLTSVRAPGGSYVFWDSLLTETWFTRVAQGASGGGAWSASGSNGLDGTGTFASCQKYS